jgi:FtsP/CotA-like multicopper oxidase with cupredoxin domain
MGFSRLLGALSFLSLALYGAAAPSSLHSLDTRADDVVNFEVTLTWKDASPIGGTPRKMIMINDTMPGPALQAKVGQTVHFMVHNQMPDPTTVHFHGITQLNTPWSDGVPGLSQEAIQPGQSYMYKWTADESGVSLNSLISLGWL